MSYNVAVLKCEKHSKPSFSLYQCHAERSLELNRKIARRRLRIKLDDHFNGEESIRAKEKSAAIKKKAKKKAKTKRKLELLAKAREECK